MIFDIILVILHMLTKTESRSYKPLLPEEKVQLALERFGSDDQRSFTSIAELAQRHKRAAAVVSRAITSAFKSGLVSVQRSSELSPDRDDATENAMLSRFSGLQSCCVISPSPKGREPSLYGDSVHAELGIAAAQFIASSAFIQDGDAIGLSGGRALFHLTSCLSRNARTGLASLRPRDIALLSLSGDNYARDHSGQTSTSFDADAHVRLCSFAFRERVACEFISRAVVCRTQQEQQFALNESWLGSERWARGKRLKGLMGVGVFAEGHRLYAEAGAVGDARERRFDAIRGSLRRLQEYSILASKDYYSPVADVANCLFFVEPPNGHVLSKDLRNNIERQIETINDQLVIAGRRVLERMHSILLVAGTMAKAHALKFILDRATLPVRYLVLDQPTAKYLVAGSTAPRRRRWNN